MLAQLEIGLNLWTKFLSALYLIFPGRSFSKDIRQNCVWPGSVLSSGQRCSELMYQNKGLQPPDSRCSEHRF